MVLDDLLSKRLIVLSGKGGVGKSVVGAALALAARERGKRVLLVEVEAPREAARYLGGRRSGGVVCEVLPGLFTLNLDPKAAMEEYVRATVRVDILARRVLESPLYHRFFAAAPGVPELITLGKVMVLEGETIGWRGRPRFDLIVLDAPATGHGLAFLKVPLAASRAVPVGPVGHNARRIVALLRDPARTALGVVAIPEEMAVVEALEFHRLATEELGITPRAIFLNGCHERRFTEAQEAEILRLGAAGAAGAGALAPGISLSAALGAARRHLRRHKLTRFYLARLRRASTTPLVALPYLFRDDVGLDDLRVLAERLEAA
ncbi:MAG TPA: ArsA-related P-loop ATPase [Vicinamibacteria bacterium]|nr:ArsA-related P-loop ATPase [Vicinamibacteria bacterium]